MEETKINARNFLFVFNQFQIYFCYCVKIDIITKKYNIFVVSKIKLSQRGGFKLIIYN